jgi:hypothetical protein
VGEEDPEGDTIFLAPFLPDNYAPRTPGDGRGGPLRLDEPAEVAARKAADYETFIDRVIEAAKSAPFKRPIGRGEERLRGFHGG